MTKNELIEAANKIIGGKIKDLPLDQVERVITVAQHVMDLCINELEVRGELFDQNGRVSLPYKSDYMVETALTRGPRS